MINTINKIKPFFCSAILFFMYANIYSQETPLGSKIVGNGDSANYYIGHFPVGGSDGLDLHWYGGIRFGDFTSNSVMQISSGNVGIGKSTIPLFKLDVNGILNVTSENNGGGIRFNSAVNNHQDSRNWIISSDGYAYGDLVFKSSSTFNGVPNDAKLIIKSNGSIGIGVVNPTNKLDVNGTIHSKEVKVDMIGWSDFVFKKEYNLPTLEEVEKHINEKGHLQNIPSQEQVLKDGINLGEMNSKLLQKIEELTLYSIEQNKEIKNLKKENEVLKELMERISKVENALQNR